MNWIFLALIPPAIHTISNFIDKFVVSTKIRDYRGLMIYGAITELIMGTIFWFTTGFPFLTWMDTILLLFAGILYACAFFLYFQALSIESASKIIILFQLTPLFILGLSSILLKEIITAQQLLGFFLVLSSTSLLSLKQVNSYKFSISHTFYLMVVVNFLLALSTVIVTYGISSDSFFKIISYEAWGVGLGGIIFYSLFTSVRESFNQSLRTTGKSILGLMFLNEFIFTLKKTFVFFLLSLAPVALVSILDSTRIFYGILFGIVLTLLFPKVFKENLDRSELLKNGIFTMVLFIGIILIY